MVLVVKNLPAKAGDRREAGLIAGSDPCVRKIPWRRAGQPTPVFLPGESHGQRSLRELQSRGLQGIRHKMCACVLSHFSHVCLFLMLWTVACQARLSLGIL